MLCNQYENRSLQTCVVVDMLQHLPRVRGCLDCWVAMLLEMQDRLPHKIARYAVPHTEELEHLAHSCNHAMTEILGAVEILQPDVAEVAPLTAKLTRALERLQEQDPARLKGDDTLQTQSAVIDALLTCCTLDGAVVAWVTNTMVDICQPQRHGSARMRSHAWTRKQHSGWELYCNRSCTSSC